MQNITQKEVPQNPNRSWRKRILKLGDRVVDISVFLIFLLCIVGFFACVIVYSFAHQNALVWWELVYMIPVGVCVFLLILAIRYSLRLCKRNFLLFWAVFFLLQSICLIVIFRSPPKGDGGGIYQEALYLYNGGEFVRDTSNYYYRCYWLMGTVFFEKLLMSIIGTSYTAFKLLGTLMLLGSGLCLYKIAENHFGVPIAKIAFALYVLFAPITLNVSHFAHQHIAFFLLLLSLLLLDRPSFPKGIAAGLLLGLMNVFRPWGILVLLALACFGTYKLISLDTAKKRLRYVTLGLALLLVYLGTGKVVDAVLARAGYLDPSLSSDSSIMWIKIDRGIDPDCNAFGEYVNEKTDGLVGQEYNDAMKVLYKDRVKQLLTTPTPYKYVANKMTRMFGDADLWFENLFENKLSVYDFPVRLLYFFNWFQYILLLPVGIYGYLRYRKKHTFCLLTVFTIGYVAAHLFIEAFSGYRVCFYPLLILFIAYGLNEWFQKDWFRRKRVSAPATGENAENKESK